MFRFILRKFVFHRFCTISLETHGLKQVSFMYNQSSATVIVSQHGGISSNILFSNDGAAALLLVQFISLCVLTRCIFFQQTLQVGPGDKQRTGAKDTHIYPWLTWLTVRYWLGTGYQVSLLQPSKVCNSWQ
jgi:hypothetical protein